MLLGVLVTRAKKLGVVIEWGRAVESVDVAETRVVLDGGEVICADFVVGADGECVFPQLYQS